MFNCVRFGSSEANAMVYYLHYFHSQTIQWPLVPCIEASTFVRFLHSLIFLVTHLYVVYTVYGCYIVFKVSLKSHHF